MSDPIKRKCPKCKKLKLNRLIGAGSGIIFREGVGGFYCKDYAPKKNKIEKVPAGVKKGAANKKELEKKFKGRNKK